MADILIRGMEMPLSKTELIVFPSGVVQVYDSRENYLGKAKVVPLPEGHGRLGDLDAIKADIEGFIECMTSVGAVVDGELLWGKLLDALDNAETIVPAEGGTDDGT